eukprot:s1005_g28.t1
MAGLGGRKKLTKMQRCLGLALETIDLKFLMQAGTIVLHQDVSKGVLVVTFSACSEKLELAKGFLGCQKLPPAEMDSLQKCTMDIVRSACAGNQTFFNEIRRKVAACTCFKSKFFVTELGFFFDAALWNLGLFYVLIVFKATLTHVFLWRPSNKEVLVADAAADEQLALRCMRADPSLFDQVKMNVKDPTHAVQRFLKRPFAAIPEISDVHATLVTRNDSMISTIQFSDVLGSAFEQFTRKLCSRRLRNLQFRKHRFNSVQRPTGRCILCFKAVLATSIFASTHRHGERDGARAERFLEYINERRLILLSMMADAADEVSVLVRYLDSGNYDLAGLVSELQQFVGRVSSLFLDGQCRNSGYCEYMLATLQTPTSFLCKATGPRSIGGDRLTDAVFQEALQDRALHGFSLLSAMSIFNLNKQTRDAEVGQDGMVHVQEAAQRLCSVFSDVDQQGFVDEYLDVRPIAIHHSKLVSVSSFEAWRQAIRQCSRRSSAAHPTHNLAKLVMRLGAWDGCSTSSVERVFAKLRRFERQLSDENRRLELKLFWDYDRIGPRANTTASTIWDKLYGAPRNGSTSRLDKGVKRKRMVARTAPTRKCFFL